MSTVGERLFAVIRTRGQSWDGSRPMEEQPEWKGHAAFMNALVEEGFVILGGPLDGTADVLLVVRARSADEVASRLAADPWSRTDLLRIDRIAPWTLRLGAIPSR
jgi:uncharacterized protein YciI